jgi:hypothetical protein
MTLAGLMEGLGLGAAREAKRLVASLPGEGLRVATSDDLITRALGKAKHVAVVPQEGAEADAALLLTLPDGDEGLSALETLVAATRTGGSVIVAIASGLGQEGERARAAGLFLRAGLVDLFQGAERGVLITRGHVASTIS